MPSFARADQQSFAAALGILQERTESPLGGNVVVLMREEEHEHEEHSTPDEVVEGE